MFQGCETQAGYSWKRTEFESSQLSECRQSPSRLKITAGRGCATPQQQASKSGCQEYPVYHQGEERCQASRGLRTGSRLWHKHRQTGTRHGKPVPVILSEARPALSSARCNPINSNQPAHHGDYFKTNGGFKASEEGFGQQRLKPEMYYKCFTEELSAECSHIRSITQQLLMTELLVFTSNF